jgi:hypothetical protein
MKSKILDDMNDLPTKSEDLKKLYLAVQKQRLSDIERQKSYIQQIQAANVSISEMKEKIKDLSTETKILKASQSNTAILRIHRSDTIIGEGVLSYIMGFILLRFARYAARRKNFLFAEVLYTAIAAFKPRPFLLKQVGNMLYQQGLYLDSIEVLDVAKQWYPNDEEINFFIGASQRALQASTS